MFKLINKDYILGVLLIILIGIFGLYPSLEKGKIIAPTDIQEAYLDPFVVDGIHPHNTSTSDGVTQYVPYRKFFEKAYREDGYIGWNPYAMCGFNMAGNTMALPGSWTAQLHRVMSLENAWNWGIIAEFLIAGIGMFTFLRDRKLKWLICILGAVMFMWNSQFFTWINHRWALGAFCWMPWILWSSKNVFIGAFERRHLLLPIFLSLALLGGSLQHIIFVVIACGCIVLSRSSRENKIFIDWQYALKWSGLFILVFGMISYSLIPQISAYLSNIDIGHVRGGIGYKNGLSQIVKHIVAIPAQIWPWNMGDPQSLNGSAFLQLGFANIAYFGTIPMVAAILGVFCKKLPTAAKIMVVLGLLIPLTPLVGPLYHRVQIVFILGGCWLACEMLNQVDSSMIVGLRKWSLRLLILVFSLLAISSSVLFFKGDVIRASLNSKLDPIIAEMQFGHDRAFIDAKADEWLNRFSLVNGQTMLVLLLLVLSIVGLHLIIKKRTHLGIVILLLSVSGELAVFKNKCISYGNTTVFEDSPAEIEEVRKLVGNSRVYQGTGILEPRDAFAPPNILSSHGIKTLDSYESIQYQSIYKASKELDIRDRYNISGVSLALVPLEKPHFPGTELWEDIGNLGNHNVLKNPTAAPFISAFNSPISETIEGLSRQIMGADKVETVSSTMSTVVFTVPEKKSYIRVNQNFHKGWKWKFESDNDWKSAIVGVDSACYIPVEASGGKMVTMKFFPRSAFSIWLALSAFVIYFLGSLYLNLKKS